MRKLTKLTLATALVAVGSTASRGRLRRYEIAEQSMRPALEPGDFVLATPQRRFARGDIVIFDYPDRIGFELVKRVIGLPNEVVTVAGGQVHIDGRVLAEPWADGPTRPDGNWPLRRDEVFVLGDNRAVSSGDSRIVGPISTDSIRWRVVGRYWPPRTAGRLS